MGYDPDLANRIREVLAQETGLLEKRMFGGLAFMIHGNMAVAASGQGGLLLRVDPDQSGPLLGEPHVELFEMRGRLMQGWLRVGPEAVDTDDDLRRWVNLGTSFAHTLPRK